MPVSALHHQWNLSSCQHRSNRSYPGGRIATALAPGTPSDPICPTIGLSLRWRLIPRRAPVVVRSGPRLIPRRPYVPQGMQHRFQTLYPKYPYRTASPTQQHARSVGLSPLTPAVLAPHLLGDRVQPRTPLVP